MMYYNTPEIESPRRKRRGTILTSIASNLRSFFCLLFLCSLTPQQATGNALAGFNLMLANKADLAGKRINCLFFFQFRQFFFKITDFFFIFFFFSI